MNTAAINDGQLRKMRGRRADRCTSMPQSYGNGTRSSAAFRDVVNEKPRRIPLQGFLFTPPRSRRPIVAVVVLVVYFSVLLGVKAPCDW